MGVDGFAEFYKQYPRRVARKAAEKAYSSIIKKPADGARLLANLPAWVTEFRQRPADKVPYPSTFLRSGQWEDPPPEAGNGFKRSWEE